MSQSSLPRTLQFMLDEEFLSEKKYYSGDILYHYTSPDALTKILKSDGIHLHFTRADFMNDKYEGQDVLILYRSVCRSLLDNGSITQEIYDSIFDIRPNQFGFVPIKTPDNLKNGHKRVDMDIYLCCFTKDNDSLPMWNYYSKNNRFEGYNIGFVPHFRDTNMEIAEVIYDPEIKKAKIEHLILAYAADMDEKRFSVNEDCIAHMLTFWQYIFKDSHFSYENEVRILLRLPRNKSEWDENYTLNYRTVNGVLVPYVEHCFHMHNLHSVTVGPIHEQEKAGYAVQEYIECIQSPHTQVNYSTVPIRF